MPYKEFNEALQEVHMKTSMDTLEAFEFLAEPTKDINNIYQMWTNYRMRLEEVLPDFLNRPMHIRIKGLLERANNEANLAVKLRQKLEEVAGPEVASSVI